ncbi:flagellar basal-body rod protein FlgF [Acanthopleuribacter pedis]|uniref:Flagellar basal-body rod protein FlgF n=1 Tax=Acanthopleuribacter pedis TaxID=442870 RepID=A0A8J7QHM3_9BACT|nr:flagellar basal-body rod protein FlgF [Acanthopleuribacter pedis]MBO1320390.1 flagellar basal-body rod protein FlgF [Acanthopleuribacter pedis]
MRSELYTAAQGLIARQLELDAASNNLANINTTGFRKTTPFFRTLNLALEDGPRNPLNGATNNQPVAGGIFIHSEQGAIRQTGNNLDLAIQGEGFFKLNTPFGPRFSRNGQFTIRPNGAEANRATLVTQAGYEVLGRNGNPITLNPNARDLVIDRSGRVYQEQNEVGRIALVTFQDKAALVPEENNLLANLDPQAVEVNVEQPQGEMNQRSLEMSNVNVAQEMMRLIEMQRAYEMNTRSIKTIDAQNDRAIQSLGPR